MDLGPGPGSRVSGPEPRAWGPGPGSWTQGLEPGARVRSPERGAWACEPGRDYAAGGGGGGVEGGADGGEGRWPMATALFFVTKHSQLLKVLLYVVTLPGSLREKSFGKILCLRAVRN